MRPGSRTPRRLLIGVAAGHVVVLAAWLGAPRRASFARGPSPAETTLEKLGLHGSVPPFALTERSGRRVTRDDLRGKVSVVETGPTSARLVLVDRAATGPRLPPGDRRGLAPKSPTQPARAARGARNERVTRR